MHHIDYFFTKTPKKICVFKQKMLYVYVGAFSYENAVFELNGLMDMALDYTTGIVMNE